MVLHTVHCPPSSDALKQCMAHAGKDDGILFLGDGVYALNPDSEFTLLLANHSATLYALDSSLQMADIDETGVPCQTVTMDEFVTLTEEYPRSLAWY